MEGENARRGKETRHMNEAPLRHCATAQARGGDTCIPYLIEDARDARAGEATPTGVTGLPGYESCRRLRSNASTLCAKGNFSFEKNPASQSASACVGCFSNSQKYFFNAKYNRKCCISLKPSSLGRSSSRSQNSEEFNPLNPARNCPTF